MVKYGIILSKRALKDAKKIKESGLKNKVMKIFEIIEDNPYTPPYEKLSGNMSKYYSRRINIQHRLVYEVLEEEKIIKVLKMWSHYE